MAEHFHGKEGVVGSIPTLGSSNNPKIPSESLMKKLHLSNHDKKVSGLCAGLAEYLNIDVSVVRLVTLTTIVFTGVLPGLFVYFIGAAVIPREGESN